MLYNPNNHHRRSIRLKGYDYSRSGLYFITLCCQNRVCLLGEIESHQMVLNDAGIMVEQWYNELPNKFPNVRCHEMVVMPNHFHGIIEVIWDGNNDVGTDFVWVNRVGVDLCVDPSTSNLCIAPSTSNLRVDPYNSNLQANQIISNQRRSLPICPAPVGIQVVVQWFKTMTTNAYIKGVKNWGWPEFNGKFWRIAEYIMNNPAKWEEDRLR